MSVSNKILYLNVLLARQIANKTQAAALFEVHSNSDSPEAINVLEAALSDLFQAEAKINILKYMLESTKKNED